MNLASGRLRIDSVVVGTAWRIAPGFALSARHCLRDRATDGLDVEFPKEGQREKAFPGVEIPAKVIADSEPLDVVLLELVGDAPNSPRLPLMGLPWDMAVTRGKGWEAEGYPTAETSGLTLSGVIASASRDELQVSCEQGGNGALENISGAAITHAGSAVALLCRAPPTLKGKVIFARPIQLIMDWLSGLYVQVSNLPLDLTVSSFPSPDESLVLPPLSPRKQGADDLISTHHYWHACDEFVGREEQVQSLLKGFLDRPVEANFRWQLVHGSAGVGKSRLAYEILRHPDVRVRWPVAGFVNPAAARDLRWIEWQPAQPILLVVDNAGLEMSQLQPALEALAGRRDRALRHPLRILFLDRTAHKKSIGSKFSVFSNSYHFDDCQYGNSIELKAIDDGALVKIMRARMDGPGQVRQAHRTDEELLRLLRSVDAEGRPFFAALIGDELGRDQRAFDILSNPKNGRRRHDLLVSLLQVQRTFWRKWTVASVGDHMEVDPVLRAHERLLALATICVARSDLQFESLTHDQRKMLGFTGYPRLLKESIWRDMTDREQGEGIFSPLRPDLLGEIFVEQVLANFTGRQQLIDLAWEIDPKGAAYFAASSELSNGSFYADPVRNLPSTAHSIEIARYVAQSLRLISRARGSAESDQPWDMDSFNPREEKDEFSRMIDFNQRSAVRE